MNAMSGTCKGKRTARVGSWVAIASGVAMAFFMCGSVHAANHVHKIGDPIGISDPQDPNAVLNYWTDEHIESALIPGFGMPGVPRQPPLLPGADQAGYVLMPEPYAEHETSRINGILFFRRPDGSDAHCSASVVASHSRSLVLTAAHCVQSGDGWNQMMMFVPAYNGGDPMQEQAPLGRWPLRQAFVPGSYRQKVEGDVAVVSIYPRAGQLLQDVVGDAFEPLETDSSAFFDSADLYGYPGVANIGDGPYHGEQRHCRSSAVPGNPDSVLTLPHCAAMDGNSGGPVVVEAPGLAGLVIGVVNEAGTYPRLLHEIFRPIYEAADEAANP